MGRKHRRWIQAIAIALAVLLAGGVVVSAVIGALAEAQPRDRYELTMEYLTEAQALHVRQRLTYVNRSPDQLDAVSFYAAGNAMRRQSALFYEEDDLAALFPAGYVPGGIDLQSVQFNGADADYGFQGADETVLRVGCDLAPGDTGEFEFDYYLLLTACDAFQGVGETDVRLAAFYFAPGVYDARYGEFSVNAPLAFTRWLYTGAADFEGTLALPANCLPAATGGAELESDGGETAVWRLRAENVREFGLSFGKRWRTATRTLDSGVRLTALTRARGANARLLDIARRAVERCEAWFGAFPVAELQIAQTDYPLGALNYTGVIWVPTALLEDAEALEHRIAFCVAQQYFGLSAYVEPSADAWLSDSVCEYVAYLLLEEEKGHDAFLAAVNRDWVDALQLTIPGGLTVTSDARLFDEYAYDVVVRVRGAVVLHELRVAMGLENLLDGLAGFYRMGQAGETLTEMDFVSAMDAASGRSWEAFLTDWVFNVGDYVNQTIDWFE